MFAVEYDEVRPAPLPLCKAIPQSKRWGIILAGGDGVRLKSLTRLISGDDRPKQFCSVLGRQTLFEQARSRAERSIAREQTIVALSAAHERYFRPDIENSSSTILLQPFNRGTAPAIILSLLHIIAKDPDAVVAVLPSDHYYSNEAAFSASFEAAFQAAGAHPESVILLGARPTAPEVEFGWIQLGTPLSRNLYKVRGFEEKPKHTDAQRLLKDGALWNTFVMVGRAMNFLWMSFCGVPELLADLEQASLVCKSPRTLHVPFALYSAVPTVDFSSKVLSPNACRLLTIALDDVEWHDLGHEDRVVAVVQSRKDEHPPWIHAWMRARLASAN